MEKSTFSSVPIWAWAVGCLVLLVICGGLVLGGGALAALVTTSRTSGPLAADSLAIVTVVPAEGEEADVATTDVAPSPTQEAGPPTPEPAASDEPTETPAQPSPPSVSPPNDIHAAERAQIEANVVEIRGLEPRESVAPTLLSMSELRQRLEDDLLEDFSPEEARQDAIALSAFDLLSPDFDLYDFTLELYTEQIAGLYDPETDELLIISDDDEFDVLEQLTHAHEFVHALQDQYYALDMLDDETLDSEASLALQSLAEGDATLAQTLYLLGGHFSQQELLDIFDQAFTIDTAVLDSAPPVLAHQLEFPYLGGLNFAQALHQQGGFGAVDEAWANPPQSTEHILHPDRYLSGDAPQLVALAPLTETLGLGWQLADEDVLGEFYLREYLSGQLEDDLVDTAATGWGGDRYAVYWNEDERTPVMVLRVAWDTPADSEEFAAAYVDYPSRLFGSEAVIQPDGGLCWQGEDVICFYRSGDDSVILRAPDLDTAASVAAAQLP